MSEFKDFVNSIGRDPTLIDSLGMPLNQDLFAIYINEYKSGGYFLDLGCNDPIAGNNSFILERMDWKGILVDSSNQFVENCKKQRKNICICADLTNIKLSDIMIQYECPEIIDYISLDLDNCAALPCIKSFDFNKHKIRCITFEHDAYSQHTDGKTMRTQSREFLKSKGLKRICSDVCVFNGKPFEDWYINPELVSEDIYKPLECSNVEWNTVFNRIYN